MRFLGVKRGAGVTLVFEVLVKDSGEHLFDCGVGWIAGKIGQFVRVFIGVI